MEREEVEVQKTAAMPMHGRFQVRSLKAKANAKRTLAEKVADKTVSGAGSFWFLTLNILLFVGWIVANEGGFGFLPFDPYPFGFLTMAVSLEAIGLSILVLLAQNRASRIGDLREEVDLQLDVITEKEITKVLEVLVLVAKKQGVDLTKDKVLKEMLSEVDREKIEHLLEAQIGE